MLLKALSVDGPSTLARCPQLGRYRGGWRRGATSPPCSWTTPPERTVNCRTAAPRAAVPGLPATGRPMSREGIQPGAAHRRFEALPDEAREAGSFDPELRALVRATHEWRAQPRGAV